MHKRKRKIDENVRQNKIRRRVGRKITHLHLVLLNRSEPGPPAFSPTSGPTSCPTSANTPHHDSSTSDVSRERGGSVSWPRREKSSKIWIPEEDLPRGGGAW